MSYFSCLAFLAYKRRASPVLYAFFWALSEPESTVIFHIRKKCVLENTKSSLNLDFIFRSTTAGELKIYPFPHFFLREQGVMKKVINN